ncbi:MAG: biotin/lipoyl-containing protein, partial [Alphaproteobacteria bacterium]
MIYDFKLPDIGEGIGEAQLISWMVALGDEIEEGAEIASVSTDKVDFELPSPCAGTIVELLWTPGDTVPVGEVLIRIERSGSPEAGSAPSPEPVPAAAPASARPRSDGGPRA